MPRKTNRRDFLRGKSALQAADDLIPSGPETSDPSASSKARASEHYLLHVGRPVMASRFEVYLNAGEYAAGIDVAVEALELVAGLEAELSFFRETSQLSRVNREAAVRPVEVGPELWEILETALRLNVETGGALDVTSTPLWEIWGFARRKPRMPTTDEIAESLECVGSRWVQLDPVRRSVQFRKAGVRLNLASMAKGYALDRCAGHLEAAGIEHFLIHGGQSSILARGGEAATRGQSSPGYWTVGLPHPLAPKQRIGQIRLRQRALGTSGSQMQSFWHQGRRYGHILDPRTGWPASHLLSVTVLAPGALLADALSTAFYVMEPDATREFCRSRPEVGAVLLRAARRAGGFEILTAGLAGDELES